MNILSLGENCLPDDILKRYGIKTFSTPFSSSRSNILYVNKLIETNFEGLLSFDLLEKDVDSPFPNLYRNKKIFNDIKSNETSIFNATCANGFEFTHHNIIQNKEHLDSYKRKIDRFNALKNSYEPTILFYHYRYCSPRDGNIEKIVEYAHKTLSLLNKKTYIIIISQIIVPSTLMRAIHYKRLGNIFTFFFLTTSVWAGKNVKKIFARYDEDLISKMMYILYENLFDIKFPACFTKI